MSEEAQTLNWRLVHWNANPPVPADNVVTIPRQDVELDRYACVLEGDWFIASPSVAVSVEDARAELQPMLDEWAIAIGSHHELPVFFREWGHTSVGGRRVGPETTMTVVMNPPPSSIPDVPPPPPLRRVKPTEASRAIAGLIDAYRRTPDIDVSALGYAAYKFATASGGDTAAATRLAISRKVLGELRKTSSTFGMRKAGPPMNEAQTRWIVLVVSALVVRLEQVEAGERNLPYLDMSRFPILP